MLKIKQQISIKKIETSFKNHFEDNIKDSCIREALNLRYNFICDFKRPNPKALM